MKRILLFLMLLFAVSSYGQSGSNRYTAGINYTVGVPTFVPQGNVSKVAIDTGTMKWYEYSQIGGWRWSGDRVQDISGCSAPAYTPGKAQSRLVLNNCTVAQNGHGPELYKYTGTEWLCLNCVTGGGGVYTGGEGIVVDSPSIRIDTLDRLSFATSPTLPGGVGTIRWNDTDGTLEFGMKGGNVTQQVGQEQLTLVKHADNSGLANGSVVYVVGSDGANKTVRLARADAESTSANTFGVMTEAATGGDKAFCTTFGLVRDLNTSALTEGAMVWLSASTAGAMTTTRPTAPNHAVQIGFCIRSHATQGVIFVSVQNGYELGELHDVSVTSPSTGQALLYSTNKWVNGVLPDASSTNELQTLSISNDTLSISDGNSVVLPVGGVTWPLLAPNGAIEAPSYSFENNQQNGIFQTNKNIVLQSADKNILLTTLDAIEDNSAKGISGQSGSAENGDGGPFQLFAGNSIGAGGGAFELKAGSSESSQGGSFTMTAGGGATGGTFEMRAGAASGSGGDFLMYSGNGSNGGNMIQQAGVSSGENASGGSFFQQAGNGYYGGSFEIYGGQGVESGGNVLINAGSGTYGGRIALNPGTGDALGVVVMEQGGGFVWNPITNAVKSTLIDLTPGHTIFCSDCTANDSSTGVLQTYNGTTWKNHW